MNNFKYALSLLETLYGVTMDEDLFEETALVAWQYIGNKRTKIHRKTVCIEDCDEGVELPCDVEMLEGVTAAFEEGNHTRNDNIGIDEESYFTEEYIESSKGFRDPMYIPGKFIKYERVGNMLYFDRPYGKVNILYRSIILDEDGLPEVTDKEAIAIATYCAYILKFKEGLQTNNGNIILLANVLKQLWLIQVDLARVDYYMSQNEWDAALNSRVNHDRKIYNKSYKMFK